MCSTPGRQHRVDHDSGDGDVEPDGKGVARDAFVLRKSTAQGEEKSDQDERQDDDRENDMADQDGQVDGPDRAVAGKNHIPMERVVGRRS